MADPASAATVVVFTADELLTVWEVVVSDVGTTVVVPANDVVTAVVVLADDVVVRAVVLLFCLGDLWCKPSCG